MRHTKYWIKQNQKQIIGMMRIIISIKLFTKYSNMSIRLKKKKKIKMMMIKNRRERTVVQMMRVIMNKRVLVNKENLHCMESGQIKIFLTRHICLFCGIDFCMFSHVVSIVRYGKHVIIQKDLKQLSYKLFT